MTVHDLVARLPDPEALKARCRAFAVLDGVLSGLRPSFRYRRAWSPGVDLVSMDTGGGDLFRIVFEPAGVFLFGFDHESETSPWRDDDSRRHWPGLLEGLPDSLARWPDEPSFLFMDFLDATVCAWRETGDTAWRCGPVEFEGLPDDADGAEWLFGELADGSAEAFAKYAAEYYSRDVDLDAVRFVLAGAALTPEIVAVLNPDIPFAAVAVSAADMGFPVADVRGEG